MLEDDEADASEETLSSFGSLDEELLERFALPASPTLDVAPRPYQQDAVRNWLANGGRGVVILPTGSGKTVVAYMVLEQVPVSTLVIVPTIELLRQWHDGLLQHLGLSPELVGVVGGGERRLAPITVMTYDSAAMPHRALSNFRLISTILYASMTSPTLMSLMFSSEIPHSYPASTSRASSLNRLSEARPPVQTAAPSRRSRTLLLRPIFPSVT